jgi:mono/diheme cytochrome c family protein
MRARWILLGLFTPIAIGLAGFLLWAWYPAIPAIEPPAASSFERALVVKGAELAAIGNCAVCHTRTGGRPFAGGLPIPTPFGVIYSTNITPDPETGVGKWSEAAFRRAMHEGVDRSGHHLYPAFPYDHFVRVTDNDLDAIYAFLMTRDPVSAETPGNNLSFPVNFRLVLAGWKLLFLDRTPFQSDPGEGPEWNRGAYLVQGLGHCGSCHTPRNFFGAEKPEASLAGGEAEGWDAPALTAASTAPVPWEEGAVFNYLRYGADPLHGVAAGPMMPVVDELARISEQDLRAIATYIASLTGGSAIEQQRKTREALVFAEYRAWGVVPREVTDKQGAAGETGAVIFAGACAACHYGRELALSTVVNLSEPRNLIRIILGGIMPPEGEKGPIMPGFADVLTDRQLAALVGYLREQFSEHSAWPDVAARVREISSGEEQR